MIFRRASLVIEDRLASPAAPPLEIKEVSFQLINDPEPTVVFEGAGSSDLGPAQLSGHWNRPTNEASLTLSAGAVPLSPALIQRVSGLCAEVGEHIQGLSGRAQVEARLSHRPGAAAPWGYDVTLTLTQGRFSHHDLPAPLEALEGKVRCIDGRIPRAELRARSGAAAFHLVARDIALPGTCDAEKGVCLEPTALLHDADLTVTNIAASEALFDIPLLRKFKKEIYERFQPSGSADVTLQLRPAGREPWQRRLRIEPRGMNATYEKFIYTLEGITGSLELLAGGPEGDVWSMDLTGHASGKRPVRVKGEVRGPRPCHTVVIDVWGDDIPLDDRLQFALDKLSQGDGARTNFGDLARSFEPTGLANFRVRVHRDVPNDRYQNHFVIFFHHAGVRYREFPYRLEDVSGTLEIRPDSSWEFRDFRGRHGETTFQTSGRCRRREDGIRMEVHGRNVHLDRDLKDALLQPELQAVWAKFDPSGRIDCDGVIDLPPAPPGGKAKPLIDLTVQARGCTVRPVFFPYEVHDLRGTFHYARDAVEASDVTGRHGASAVRLDRAVVLLKPAGGFTADLTYLHVEPLHTDEALLKALRKLHESLWLAWAKLEVQGPLDLHARLYVDSPAGTERPRLFWDGSVVLRDASLKTGVKWEHVSGVVSARGWFNGNRLDGVDGNLDLRELSVFGQPLRNLRGELLVTEDEPDVLKFPGLMASYLSGQVYGPARIEFGSRLRYELDLTASQVRLEEFARHNFRGRAKAPEMSGQALARLHLKGEGTELAGLRGDGRLDVPSGKIENLHPLVDLLKFLGLRWPDRTAFEEAHATFTIEGKRAKVRKLELFGNAISLRGDGEMDIDGSDVALDFHVDWARLGQVLPAGVREIPREISNQLFKIEARGRLEELRFRKQPVPLLTDPLRRLWTDDEDKGRK
jgi:hypothetical protein